MSANGWVSIVAVLGWLLLALSALRARRIGARTAVTMTLVWLAVFALATAVFAGLSQ
jgi:hypothetical protein